VEAPSAIDGWALLDFGGGGTGRSHPCRVRTLDASLVFAVAASPCLTSSCFSRFLESPPLHGEAFDVVRGAARLKGSLPGSTTDEDEAGASGALRDSFAEDEAAGASPRAMAKASSAAASWSLALGNCGAAGAACATGIGGAFGG